MTKQFTKKILFLGMSIISIAPITFFLSCSNNSDNTIENQLLDLELKDTTKLKISNDLKLDKIHLLDLGANNEQLTNSEMNINNNEQLSNIFILPDPKIAETNDKYGIFYSWDFTKKDIVSFDREGNINFEINVNVGLRDSNKFITKPKIFTINTEKTIIIENETTEEPRELEASMYVYNGIDKNNKNKRYEFQAIRQDIFEKSKNFNIDFYSKDSIINNRPIIIKKNASNFSAMDAYSVERLIEPPNRTSSNNTQYNFNIDSVDFVESNPRKGIYKIKVTPVSDNYFNSTVMAYAKEKYNLSFSKFYYFYEPNVTFKYPTENNISTHTSKNSSMASQIGQRIESSSLAFMPTVKNPGLIIGKNTEEILKINTETPGGIFVPPVFQQQYSVEPTKLVSVSISSVSSSSDTFLTFVMLIKVGNSNFEMSKSVNKIINIKQLL